MKRITLYDFYLRYPYKCQEIYGKTVPKPYVPKSEIDCEHTYSKEYKEWSKQVDVYLGNVLSYLQEGHTFEIPNKMGRLKLKKIKGNYYDHNKKEHTNDRHLGNHRILIKWFRQKKDNGVFRYKWLWRIRLTKKAWTKMINLFKRKPTQKNKIENA